MKKPEWLTLDKFKGFLRAVFSYAIGTAGVMSPDMVAAENLQHAAPAQQHLIAVFQLWTVIFGCGIVAMRFAYDFIVNAIRLYKLIRSWGKKNDSKP